ncbi:MAG: hypothetical protein M3R01_01020 [Actinomycetota bacterium]|nr:hypothetical protein [Actinomycetota bacterium]
MGFTQTIEVTTKDEAALREQLAGWHAEQHGIAPGYQGARILADEEHPGRYVIEVDFTSRGDADRNNERPETAAWAARLGELTSGDPTYRSFRQVSSTREQ